jgi:hypothetical protein
MARCKTRDGARAKAVVKSQVTPAAAEARPKSANPIVSICRASKSSPFRSTERGITRQIAPPYGEHARKREEIDERADLHYR